MSLMISVSGVRGLVGETFTPAVVLQFAQAYGTLLGGGRVVLGRDSRPSGQMYAAAAAAGLTAAGCAVTDLGVVMTPTIGRAIRDGQHDGGLMITASHNPQPWNGLKVLDNQGLAPDPEQVEKLVQIRAKGAYHHSKDRFSEIAYDDDAGRRHLQAVQEQITIDTQPLQGLRVVLDSVNGAGCLVTPELLVAMGCDVIHLNGDPTGVFAHPPEPIAENLQSVCDAVQETQAQVGFVQDPDADRLAIIDENGRFIGEEYTLAFAADALLRQRKGAVAANLSTSRMIDDVAARHGVKVVRTPVGEAHVARGLLKAHGVVGGEGNGGVIDPRISPVRDSLSGISLVLQLMALTGKSISELVQDLPAYASVKEKFECPRDKIDAAVKRVAQHFADQRINQSDGVRIDFPAGWIHLRASNTEPIVRIISEADDAQQARALVADVRQVAGL
jgi:phosphomannomutase